MNKSFLTGRLTRDPETTYNSEGKPVTKFTLAVDRKFKSPTDMEKCDFFNMTTFGKRAEHVAKYYKKGMKMDTVATCKIDAYANDNGEKIRTYDWYPEEIEFGESNKK